MFAEVSGSLACINDSNVPINFGMREILKRLKPYLTTAKANAAKTGSFNPNILEKGLSEMQKIFDELEI